MVWPTSRSRAKSSTGRRRTPSSLDCADPTALSSAKQAKLLHMYKSGTPNRNAQGKITQSAAYQSIDAPVARIAPNRRWFTNTRVISQESLAHFARQCKKPRATLPSSCRAATNYPSPS